MAERGQVEDLFHKLPRCLMSGPRRKHHRDEDKKEKEMRDKDHVRRGRVFRTEPNGPWIFGVRSR